LKIGYGMQTLKIWNYRQNIDNIELLISFAVQVKTFQDYHKDDVSQC
jgi:hypothetical protein